MSNEVRQILMPVGIPASGKSTWAKKQVWNRDKVKRVSKDNLREMLDNGEFSMKNEGYTLSVRDFIARSALLQGYDVIIDDTNFNPDHFDRMIEIAKAIGGNIKITEVFFEVTLKEALRRNENREDSVPQHIVEGMYKKHIKAAKRSYDRDVYVPPTEHPQGPFYERMVDSSKKPAIIVDLDGTLAINDHGRSYYDMSQILNDSVKHEIAELVRMYHEKGYLVIAVSGRNHDGLEDSKTWMQAGNIPFDKMYHREEGDSRDDAIYKKELFEKEISQYCHVELVIDDRSGVVDMWRSLGLKCLQVAHGDF